MNLLNYRLLWLLLTAVPGLAQPVVDGLGPFRMGVTTPDSLSRVLFREDDPPLVNGTIALPCHHIRLFSAASVPTAGATLHHVVLAFYDGTLLAVSCDWTDSLAATFRQQHGPGVEEPERRVPVCTTRPDEPARLQRWGWTTGDVRAVASRVSGLAADCRPLRMARLIIVSQWLAGLSSDCALPVLDPFAEVVGPP